METKIFSLVLLTAILLLTVASAASVEVTLSGDLTKSTNSVDLTIKNNEVTDKVTVTSLTIPSSISDGTNSVSITNNAPIGSFEIPAGTNNTKVITLTRGAIPSAFKTGVFTGTVSVLVSGDTAAKTATLTFANDYCRYGEKTTTAEDQTTSFSITDLEDRTVDNEDEWEWRPLDNIEFRVEVSNDGTDEERVKVEYDLYDKNWKKVSLDDETNEQSLSINDGDSEKVTFSLKVPADMDDGDYKLFVKAYLKSDEEEACADTSDAMDKTYYQTVSIVRDEDRAVVIDISKLDIPENVKCGDSVTISPKLYNIGVEDEDKVKVNIYNSELGINMDDVINDLGEGESATATFTFKVPGNVEGKNYFFRMITFYEYDEDTDEYDSNSKDDLDREFNFNMKVDCVKETVAKSASITAELTSDIAAGEQLSIKGTIKNTGSEDTTYSLAVTGYDSWSSLDRIDPSTITLKPGESKDFNIYLDINEDATGEQSFKIRASFDGKLAEREVKVELEEGQPSGGITGSAIADYLRGNWFIWVIILVNVILIIAIIIVARRIATSR